MKPVEKPMMTLAAQSIPELTIPAWRPPPIMTETPERKMGSLRPYLAEIQGYEMHAMSPPTYSRQFHAAIKDSV
jgi:hypothetical protein